MLLEIDAVNNKFSEFVTTQMCTEKTVCDNHRKSNGIFLTNDADIIDNVLDCLPNDDSLLSMKFLEPSCGHGIFILKLISKAYLIQPHPILISKFIEENIFFADIEQLMIQHTENKISEFYEYLFEKRYTKKFNSFCMDFTLKQKYSLFQIKNELHEFYGKFDVVLGNPPYVTLYGRRDKKKNEAQRINYLQNYDQFPTSLKNGKINFVMLFIEHGIDFLRDGGILSFIVDVSFFETAYIFCRKYLIENTRIHKLIYNIQGFEGVASGQIVITISKEKVRSNKVLVVDYENKKKQYIEQFDWHDKNDEFKFRIDTSKEAKSILDKIFEKNDPTLKDLYPQKNLRTCVMLLNMEDKFTVDKKPSKGEENIYPYYQGSKGLKYKYSRPTHSKYFVYNKMLQDTINEELKIELTKKGIKNKKRLGLGEIDIYENPKVFIRQSAKELIATYDEKPSSANNSLYVFSLRDNSNTTISFLKYLCGLLNSKLYTFFAQQRRIIRYNKGKQPQIKISDLYQIKVPCDMELQKKIEGLVNNIYTQNSKIDKYKSEIDSLIYAYYRLTENDIKSVDNSILSYLK